MYSMDAHELGQSNLAPLATLSTVYLLYGRSDRPSDDVGTVKKLRSSS